jgi:phosphoribosylanthranilate isomerase
MALIIKICGLKDLDSVETAISAGADMVGIVFFLPSPRHVPLKEAARLATRARGRAQSVLVTVNMARDELLETVAAISPEWIQFHGHESPDHVAAMTALTGRRAIKALGISTHADLTAAEAYADVADMLLLDTKPPADADRPGGHGVTFDWDIVAGRETGWPYLLSGGLTPANIGAAIRGTGATGVDVSSGVERAPGQKDPNLIRQFIANARQAARSPADAKPTEKESIAQ